MLFPLLIMTSGSKAIEQLRAWCFIHYVNSIKWRSLTPTVTQEHNIMEAAGASGA